MKGEIEGIANQKFEEFETRKESALLLMQRGLRGYRALRSNTSDTCYICLNQFENGVRVSHLHLTTVFTAVVNNLHSYLFHN